MTRLGKGPVADLMRMMRAHEKEYDRAQPKKEYGVFQWTVLNQYPRSDAVRVFKREADAKRYADSHDGNLVVRTV